MEKNHVLHIVTRSDWGGAQRVVQLLSTRTSSKVSVACGTGGRLISKLEENDIPVYEIESLKSSPSPYDDINAFYEILQLIRTNSFDIVHCHSTKAGLIGRIASKISGTPVIFTVHGWGFYNTEYGPFGDIIKVGERALARITDAIVCVSDNDFRIGKQEGIIQKSNTTVIRNGIPPISVSGNGPYLRKELDINQKKPILGAVARLSPQKNPLQILTTAKQLQDRGYNVATVLVGDGPLMETCQRYIDKNDIDDAHLLGFRKNALDILPEFDIFLLPSRFEGLPLSVLEAMHTGLPLVAYDVGGIPEVIQDGETGYVVEHGDTDSFVSKTQTLLDNPQFRQEMGKKALQLATTEYTAERMVSDYERIYRDVIS